MDFNEDEEQVKAKGKMIAITTLSVIGVIIVFIIIGIFIIKSFFSELSKKYYYTLEINDNNRNQIIKLFEEERENIYDLHYCSSMYKIEYAKSFPDGTSYTIYCKDEDNIHFGIDKTEEDKLQSYIYENGTVESR